MTESSATSVAVSTASISELSARLDALDRKVEALNKDRSNRLGSLALLFSLIATLLALPSGVTSAWDELFKSRWNTGFQPEEETLTVTYVPASNQLRVDVTTVAVNNGKDEDQISGDGAAAVLGKQVTQLKGSFALDDPQQAFKLDAAKTQRISGHALFNNPAAAQTFR